MESIMIAVLNSKRYGELLSQVLPHVIRSAKEHKVMLQKAKVLMLRGKDLSKEESDLLELIVALIEDWERKQHLGPTASPIEALRFLMESNGHSPKDLWHVIDKTALSRVLSDREDRRGISKAQAKRLGEFYHVSPALFL
jgi:HTH-type transcriptional regulator/antitoxin HigA